ncbi:MAG: VOC family protein [Pseudonocardia sp.]|uniref:VOC family protein n=1 Tax=Pseudonocardia sp. TaxID=60912 RepID=UPI001AC3E756|nr:VOC family protein [Pseudonocardia sp.]MBN9101085.1 VOC family protein [Pseudonocardia sp.]
MTFRGFATITFYADDLAAARDWYTELLGLEPYFAFPEAPAAPAYIEFRVGDDEDELGFVDRKYAPAAATGTPGGAIMNWHVDDVAGTLATLLAMGATEYEPLTPRGDSGFVTASVVDPFGNVLGIMHNPHYLEILAARASSPS